MCLERQREFRQRRQGGFSIVSAIFLLIVLATLGAMMVTFSTVQHTSTAQDVQGARAYQAARAGAEWGLWQVLQNANRCPATTTLAFGGTLNVFAVTVNCTAANPVLDEGRNITHFTITSTATNGATVGTADYIERRVEVTLMN